MVLIDVAVGDDGIVFVTLDGVLVTSDTLPSLPAELARRLHAR